MRLEAHDAEPGLWVNPGWKEGTPGAFAVIIGVSAYTHLKDGDAPAAETYGLGQLQVSALTAYRLFCWLAEDYRLDGCPLAKCWLLLAPTEQERQHTPAITENLPPPTFANCQDALRYWRHHMTQLPQAAAETSRALFFFSGHGLEVHQDQQVLLPSDYLHPPSPSWNDAISIRNLKKGLASLSVPHQLFLLDACRNDHDKLKSKQVTGADILSEDEAAQVNPTLVAPLLYATASGQEAYQQPTPQRGLSLFGQALLDGLTGQPYIALDPLEDDQWAVAVKLYSLQKYMKQRVLQLIKEANAYVQQFIKLGGTVDDEVLTSIAISDIPPRPEPESEAPLVRGTSPEVMPWRAREIELPQPLVVRDVSLGDGHFGSEYMTALWGQHVRLFALAQRRWLDVNHLELHKIESNESKDLYHVTLSVANDDAVGYWLQFDDPASVSHACILPAEADGIPRYVLELDVPRNARGQRYVSRYEAFLAADNADLLEAAAALWQRYRTSHVGEATDMFAGSVLQPMVANSLDSPLAATVSALVLLRANQLDLLHQWVRHLANTFEPWPDGSALWAEQLMRPAGEANHASEAADYLLDLLQRGLPHTSEALGYAAGLADMLSQPAAPLSEHTAASLARLKPRLQDALIYFRPGGLFATYAGFPADTEPTSLVGPFI